MDAALILRLGQLLDADVAIEEGSHKIQTASVMELHQHILQCIGFCFSLGAQTSVDRNPLCRLGQSPEFRVHL